MQSHIEVKRLREKFIEVLRGRSSKVLSGVLVTLLRCGVGRGGRGGRWDK